MKNKRRLALKLLTLGGIASVFPRGAQANAEPMRWHKPVLGWRALEWPNNFDRDTFVSQCAIAMSKWRSATGLRFEYGGDDVLFRMSSALPTYVSARAEWPPPRGESRTCNIWLSASWAHTLHNEAGQESGLACNMQYELLHEIGHVLGFEHTGRATSGMYSSSQYPFALVLDAEDEETARARYASDANHRVFLGGLWR